MKGVAYTRAIFKHIFVRIFFTKFWVQPLHEWGHHTSIYRICRFEPDAFSGVLGAEMPISVSTQWYASPGFAKHCPYWSNSAVLLALPCGLVRDSVSTDAESAQEWKYVVGMRRQISLRANKVVQGTEPFWRVIKPPSASWLRATTLTSHSRVFKKGSEAQEEFQWQELRELCMRALLVFFS